MIAAVQLIGSLRPTAAPTVLARRLAAVAVERDHRSKSTDHGKQIAAGVGVPPDSKGTNRMWPMFVGISQGGASWSAGQTQMPKFSFAGGQATTDFTQGLGVPQLTKEHSDELTPATETPSMPLSAVLTHGRFELQARD